MTDQPPNTRNEHSMPSLSTSDSLAAQLRRTSALDAPPRPGLLGTLDRFEILEVLGEGGMGVVLAARDPATEVKIAIKMLRPELTRDRQLVKRFLAEARHMLKLDHDRILRVREVCDRPAGPYYVMAYKPRGSLAQLIEPGEPLEPDRALGIATDVADALAHAHVQGIVHRDVKPLNVLLDEDDRACLADFGLVRAFDRNDSMVEPGHEGRVGTAAYMSPAVARGEAEDTRCDIYSFGALLYEILSGVPPYTGNTCADIMMQILSGPPVPVRTRNPNVPAALARIVEGCMARELRDRYASMDDVLLELRRVAAGETPIGPHGRSGRKGNWYAVIMATVFALAIISWFAFPRPETIVPTGHETASGAPVSPIKSAEKPVGENPGHLQLLIARAWKPSWSPDGTRIAVSRPEGAGIAILDLASRSLTSIASAGKDPCWSPKGDWIAYVHQEFFNESAPEVRIVDPAGKVNRALAPGEWPNWSSDGREVYVVREDGLYAVSLDGEQQERRLFDLLDDYPWPSLPKSSSRMAQTVEYEEKAAVAVRELPTGKFLQVWQTPLAVSSSDALLFTSWSPNGDWLVVGDGFGRAGLWLLDFRASKAARVASGPCACASWSPDGSRFAVDLRPAGFPESEQNASIWLFEMSSIKTLKWEPIAWGDPQRAFRQLSADHAPIEPAPPPASKPAALR